MQRPRRSDPEAGRKPAPGPGGTAPRGQRPPDTGRPAASPDATGVSDATPRRSHPVGRGVQRSLRHPFPSPRSLPPSRCGGDHRHGRTVSKKPGLLTQLSWGRSPGRRTATPTPRGRRGGRCCRLFTQGPPFGSAGPAPPHQLTSSPTSRNRLKIPTVPDRPASDPCPWPPRRPPEPGTTESVVSDSMRQVGSKVFILSHRNIQEIKNSSCLHSSPTEPTNQPDRPTKTPSLRKRLLSV